MFLFHKVFLANNKTNLKSIGNFSTVHFKQLTKQKLLRTTESVIKQCNILNGCFILMKLQDKSPHQRRFMNRSRDQLQSGESNQVASKYFVAFWSTSYIHSSFSTLRSVAASLPYMENLSVGGRSCMVRWAL